MLLLLFRALRVLMLFATFQVALENGITVNASTYQIAHDRATFMAANKVQKLLEQGGHAS